MYIKRHVETVDTKDQSNAIVYWVWYLVCWHCRYEDQSMQCIECYVCQHCWHWCLWLLHNTVYRVMRCENCTLLCIKWPLTLPRGKAILKAFCLVGLAAHQSKEAALLRDPCLVSTVSTFIVLIVWLESPQSQLSKTFCRLKIGWILRKLWAGMCGCVLTVVSTVSTNIAFNALHA